MNRVFVLAALTAGASLLSSVPGDAQLLRNRPFLTSLDGTLSARIEGTACAETVSLVFTGRSSGTFNDQGIATRLMNNAAQRLAATCGTVKLVTAKGVVNERVVYNAVAERSTSWELLELGSSRDSSLFANGEGGTAGDQANFQKRRDFADFGGMLRTMGGQRFLCVGSSGAGCTSVTELRNASAGTATMISRSLLDGRGTVAVLTYATTNQSGFLCGNPQGAQLEVVGNAASPIARQRMATDLRERLRPYGNRVCNGYALRGNAITGANFASSGAKIGDPAVLTMHANMPKLRRAD